MSFNWLALEEQFNKVKPQAKEGEYKAQVTKAEVKRFDSGSIGVSFTFTNKDYNMPWGTHWMSLDKRDWTRWHHKQMFCVLGMRDEDAKLAIEGIENTDDPDTLVKKYQETYSKIVAKKPEVEVIVRPQYNKDGTFRYNKKGYQQFETEFLDPRVFINNKPKEENTTEAEPVAAPEPAPEPEQPQPEGEPINLDEVPF